jgi:hypothetical protein
VTSAIAGIAGKNSTEHIDSTSGWWRWPLGLLLFLVFWFCVFYCLLFFAKVLVAAETRKASSVDERVEVFMQILFWPFGVWGLQPRINKIFLASL